MMAINAGDITWNIGADLKGFEKGINKAKTSAQGLGKTLKANSKAIGVGMTAAGAVGVAAFGSMASKAADFSKSMAEVNTLGIKDLEGLSDAVKDVSGEFGLNLADSAKGAYQAISAGAKEAETPLILEKAAIAATAGVSDLTTAIELGTGVSNAFGIEFGNMEQVFDQAFVAVKGGVTTFEELSASVGKISPIMAAAGLESGEMFAAIGALTKGGIATSEAVTGLKGAISGVLKPTTEAAKLAESLGLEFNAAALESQGLGGFLDSVKEATGGNIETMTQLFGSVEALNTVLALTGNQASDFNSLLKQMDSATGSSKEAFDAFVAANPAFAFEQMKAKMAALAVDIGTILLPALITLAERIIPIVTAMRDWARDNPVLVEGLVLLGVGISALMLILGPILVVLPGITAAMGLFTTSTVVAGTAATGASVGIGAMAVASLGAAVPFIALGAVIAIASASIWENIKATKALGVAVEQEKQSEERFGKAIEEGIVRLEKRGIAVNRAEMATMSLDEQQQHLIKTFKENSKAIQAGEKATDSSVKATDVSISKIGENIEATKKGEDAQHDLTNEVVQGKDALARLAPKIDHAAGKYKFLASAARKAESAIKAANEAAAQSGGGGGGGSDSGGGGANGFAGFSGGGGTIGSAPSGFGGFSAGASRGSSSRGAVSVSPSIVVNIDGSGLSASELYAEFEAKLFDSMATNLKIAMG